MSIKNSKTAIELLSLIASLMDEDDLTELRAAMGNDEPDPEPDEWDGECPDHHDCTHCRYEDICGTPDDPSYEDEDDDEDDPDEWDDEDEPDLNVEINIRIPEGMPCIVMGGTDDELPLAMELIKEMGLVSPTPAPAKSRVRGEMVNRGQRVPEGSISGRMLRELIDRATEPAEGSAAWLDKYHY